MMTRKLYLGLAGLLVSAAAVFLLVSNSTNAASKAAVNRAVAGVRAGDSTKAGCPHAGMAAMESYVFTGVVKKVDVEKKRIVIQHENIGDYMQAMTMPFSVRDAALLKGLEPGMTRWFVLHVMGDHSMIVAVSATRAEAEKAMAAVAEEMHGAGEGHDMQGASGHEGHEGGACCSTHAGKGTKTGSHAGCSGH